MSLADPLDVKAALQARNDPALDSNDNSPDEGLIEDFTVIDKKAVEQLTEGLISHYLPDLQRSKLSLKELTQNQEVLLETLQQEISKFKECNSVLDINVLRRALKLQQKRQKEELEREQQREKELEREKQLTAKPAKRT
ncbi:biogenesis of lysosome-related organelles complex 1 subunit 6 isoform X2 [Lacerta agilis]|uniref:biogenesis of lysosome-related organelles complex 1 subunit 6 isoform X2 n=1 Tax=Lacerta agilis TaxID=80427 RepID=UPI001419E45E|nr:biogenesis of lysosome-related organelles complex 1 subunit 6 isoform X2 [Lacerta agilis]